MGHSTAYHSQLDTIIGRMWLVIFLYCIALLIFQFYAPSANTFVHRFDFDPVGSLITTRWSYDFWVSCMNVLLWFVPITLAYALNYAKVSNSRWRLWVHFALDVALALWLFFVLIFQGIDWSHANQTDVGNYFNSANDPRWCCVWYSLPNAPCANNVACPGVNAAVLTTNPVFLYQYWFMFCFFFILIVLAILIGRVVAPAMVFVDGDGDDNGAVENSTYIEFSSSTTSLPYTYNGKP